MSYRYYLGFITNEKLKSIKNVNSQEELHTVIFPNKEFNKDNDYIASYEIINNNLFEFGSDVNRGTSLFKEFGKSLFKNKSFKPNYINKSSLYSIDMNGLIFIIDKTNEEVQKYYQNQWALSTFLNVIIQGKEYIEKNKDDFSKACEFIFTKEYNHHQFDLVDINVPIEELFDDSKENARNEALIYCSENMQRGFKSELNDVSRKQKFYNLDMSKPFTINNTCKRDKSILELVHILKTFNFKKNKSIGWFWQSPGLIKKNIKQFGKESYINLNEHNLLKGTK